MSGLGRRYAAALYGLAPDEEVLVQIVRQLQGEGPLWACLLSPAVRPGEKERVLQRLPPLGGGPEHRRFLQLLARQGRMALLPDILQEFHALCLEGRNAAECTMTCVRVPTAGQQAQIKAALCRRHHRAEVTLLLRTDPALLGGFTLEMEGVTYDQSIRGRLRGLARQLEEGNRP